MNIFKTVLSNERVKSAEWVFDSDGAIRTEEGLCPLEVYFSNSACYTLASAVVFGWIQTRAFMIVADVARNQRTRNRVMMEQALMGSIS